MNDSEFEQLKAERIAAWQLENVRPFERYAPTGNFVAIAYSSIYQKDVVLKILRAKSDEIKALRCFPQTACVPLLAYDLATNSFLLQLIKPGISLKTFFPERDEEAMIIAADLVKRLHEKGPSTDCQGFKTVKLWLARLMHTDSKKIPQSLIVKARDLADQLLANPGDHYLLHGDLHHENILQGENAWIAIDPKGVIGPLAYELGRIIMNPIPDLLAHPDAAGIIDRRINQLSEIFTIDRQLLIDWLFVQVMLSACWSEEDNDDLFLNYFIAFGALLARSF